MSPIVTDQELAVITRLRPQRINSRGLCDPSWGGQCVHLTGDGCALPWESRPTVCRSLEPRAEGSGNCVDHSGSKETAPIVWLPYGRQIRAALKRLDRETQRAESPRKDG